MKEILIAFSVGALTLCTARPAPASMTEYSTTNRAIAVTNTISGSEVRPLAAYILFQSPATGSVSISRVTAKGLTVPLARHGFTNAAALTWLAPADFPLRRGEAFAVSSTVARFTLQLETTGDSTGIERTDAPEWYDEGRPFTVQLSGGGNTQVTVTNTAQLIVTNSTLVVVTNAPQIVITNIVNVTGGGGGVSGDYIPNNGTWVATNGTYKLWADGASLAYGNDNGAWWSYLAPAAVGLRGESTQPYYMGYQQDLGERPQLIFHDPTHGTVTMDDLLATHQDPWTTDQSAAGHSLYSLSSLSYGNLEAPNYFSLTPVVSPWDGTHWGLQIYDHQWNVYANVFPTIRSDSSPASAGDVLTADGSGNYYAAPSSGGAGGGGFIPSAGPWVATNAMGALLSFYDTGNFTASLRGTRDDAGPEAGWELTGPRINLTVNVSPNAGPHTASIYYTSSGDLTFSDYITGTKTLAELAGGSGSGSYIPLRGPWTTTNDSGSRLTFGTGEGTLDNFGVYSTGWHIGYDTISAHDDAGHTLSAVPGSGITFGHTFGGNNVTYGQENISGDGDGAVITAQTQLAVNYGTNRFTFADGALTINGNAGVTEDVGVSDGIGGTMTLHFIQGLYVGHTAP